MMVGSIDEIIALKITRLTLLAHPFTSNTSSVKYENMYDDYVPYPGYQKSTLMSQINSYSANFMHHF